MFNPVTPHQYLLPNLYLPVEDIANKGFFACGSETWISLDIARFYEEHYLTSSRSVWPACQKMVIGHPLLEGPTQFAQGLPDRYDSFTT